MSKSLSPLQADILAVLAVADGPVSTTDVRNELNADVGRRVVAEQVYTALRGLHGRGLVRRAQATGTRNAHWHSATTSRRRAEMAINADDADTAAAPDPGVRAVGRAAGEAAGLTWPPLCGLLLGVAVALAVALIRLVDSADTELRVPASAGQLYCDVAGGSAHPAGHPGAGWSPDRPESSDGPGPRPSATAP